jgi:ribonuclease HI
MPQKSKLKKVVIYTDGACSGNPGPGGWGAVLIYNKRQKEISGFAENTTNQQMEIAAALEALRQLKEPCEVDIYSDSAYLVNAFIHGWINRWQKNGWRNAEKKPVANREFWEKLLDAAAPHSLHWHKVAAHGVNELNNRCDYLARQEIKKARQ